MSGGWNPTVHLFSQSPRPAALRRDASAAFVPGERSRRERSAGACNGAFDAREAASTRVPRPARRRPATPASTAEPAACPPSRSRRRQPLLPGWARRPGRRRAGPSSTSRTTSPPRTSGLAVREGFTLDRARQALHHDGHGHRPGQDRQRQRAGDRRAQALGKGDRGRRHHDLPPALHAGDLRRLRRPEPRRAVRPDPHARRSMPGTPSAGRGVRGRRQLEAAALLPARRRGHARRRRPRMPRPRARRSASSTPPRSARSTSRAPDAGDVPQPRLHQRLVQARGRPLPLRPDAAATTAWCSTTASPRGSARPLPHDDHDRRRRPRAGLARGAGCRPSGRSSRSTAPRSPSSGPSIARRRARARATCCAAIGTDIDLAPRGLPAHELCATGTVAGVPARVFRISFSGELAYEINVPGRLRPPRSGRRCASPASRSASRPTAPRRCTCCAPRRATSSSARTPTAR